ncbi:MAG: tetratricopeptide repeat protein [Holosporaceae bacterium]|jgi:Flp pilus assembly protein TadD|nr:tetratricopeptide repeat protein [Holosporaceae bacterium]
MNFFWKALAAISLLTGCAGNDGGSSGSMTRIAEKARRSGNSEAAMRFYERAIVLDANNAVALYGLAEVYIDLRLLDAALAYIKKAEEKGGNMARAAYLRGKVYLLSGDNAKAEREFLKSSSIDAKNALGAVYDGRGEHQRAQHLYRQVIAEDPNYVDAYNNLGLSLLLCEKHKDAICILENACSLPGANVANRSNLALAYGISGDVEKAKAVYAQDFDGDDLTEKISYLEDIISSKRQQQ